MPRKITKKVTGVYEKVPGSGIWWIRFKSNGVERREKIGRRGDAIKVYQDRKTRILRGEKLPATLKNRGLRFDEIGQAAIDWYKRTGKKDLRTFEGRMKAIMLSPLGRKAADDINHDDIEKWINQHENWSPATRNRYKTVISRAYSLALKSKRVISNPARLVDNLNEDNERIRWLSADEERRLRAAIDKRCADQLPALVIAMNTGMRKGEQFRLTWDDVHLEHRHITLRNTKNGKTRHVQLNQAAFAAFKTIFRSPNNCYVFQASRYDTRLKDPKKWFENALKEAKVRDFRWHDLRHTFISRLVMAGVPLSIVQRLAGHGDPKMTARYIHLAPKVIQDAVNTLDTPAGIDPAEQVALQALDSPRD